MNSFLERSKTVNSLPGYEEYFKYLNCRKIRGKNSANY